MTELIKEYASFIPSTVARQQGFRRNQCSGKWRRGVDSRQVAWATTLPKRGRCRHRTCVAKIGGKRDNDKRRLHFIVCFTEIVSVLLERLFQHRGVKSWKRLSGNGRGGMWNYYRDV